VTPFEIITSNSAESSETAGRDFSTRLRPGDVVLLEGELAAGKTTFVHGLVDGLGGNPDLVSSPTFVLLQSYGCHQEGITVLHHVEDTLSDPTAIIAVEWPKDTLATWIPADARVWRVAITTDDADARRIEITPPT